MKKTNTKLSLRLGKWWLYAMLALIFLHGNEWAQAQCNNLVVNGNFAAPHRCPEPTFTSDYTCDPTAPINGSGSVAVTANAATWNGPWWGVDRLGGTNFLIADGANSGNTRAWIQSVNVIAGQQYTFTIWARNLVNPGSGAGVDRAFPTVSLRVNNTVLTTSPALAQTAPNVWTQVSATYTATTTGPVSLNVLQNIGAGYNDIGLDDISFTAIVAAPVVTNTSICSGNTATLTANGATANATYVWYTAATGGNQVFRGNPYTTPVLNTTTNYWVEIQNAAGCTSKRAEATVTVNPTPTVPVVQNERICTGTSATLTAPINQAITYKWYNAANGGTLLFTGNPFITPPLNANTKYWVSATSAAGCVSARGQANVHIANTPVIPTANNVTICGPATATLTAQGNAANHVWYTSATGGTAVFTGNPFVTPVLATNTSYWVAAKNAVGCESPRHQVNVTVNPKPADPTATGANRCGCGTLVLAASGSTGTYNWYNNTTGGNVIATGTSFTTPNICNTTTYYVSVIGTNGCTSNRVPVTATINATDLVVNGNFVLPTGCPQATFTSDYTCESTAPLGGMGRFAITNNAGGNWNRGLWRAVDRLGGTNFLIADGGVGANTRLWIQKVNVVAGQKYTYTAWAKNIVDPITVGNEGPNLPTVSIRVNGVVVGTTAPLVQAAANVWSQVSTTYTATTTGTITLDVFQNLTGIYNDVAIDDISFVMQLPTPVVTDQTICAGNTATLTASGGYAGCVYEWYNAATGGTLLFTGDPFVTPVLNANTSYWVDIRTPNGCVGNRVKVNVVVNPTPAIPVVNDVTICANNTAAITATGTGPFLWYTSATGGTAVFTGNTFTTPILVANTSYWVSAKNNVGCESNRVKVNVIVNPLPPAPVMTNGSRCNCGTVQLSATGSNGAYNWYDASTAGNLLFTGSTFTTPNICTTTNYWVSTASASGCVSPRAMVTATVFGNPNLVVNGNFAAPNSCPENGFTSNYQCNSTPPINVSGGQTAVGNNAATWNGPWWGVDRLGGTNFLIADGGIAPNTRIWIQSVNVVAGQQYTFSIWARNLVNPGSGAGIDAAFPTLSLRVNNTILTTSVGLPQTAPNVWTQIVGTYTATTTGPVVLDVFQNITNGYNDVGVDDISFTAKTPTPAVNNVTSCANFSATLTATGAPAGSVYVWYDAATAGTLLFTGNPFVTPVLTATTSYWVAIRDVNGCETDRVKATVTINGDPVITSVTNPTRCDCGSLTLTATGDAGTYNWYDASTGANLLATANSFTTPSICRTTNYYVAVTNANGCVSKRSVGTASITGPSVVLTGPTQVYANAYVNYQLTITNNSGADMTGIVINPSLGVFILDNTTTPNPSPVGPYTILANDPPLVVTYRGYYPTAGNTPHDLCFEVVANGCTTNVCKTITNVYAGCPFAYSAVTSDCDNETYGPNGVIKTIVLAGHNNFFDINKIDFNLTYDPTLLELVSYNPNAGSPAGTTMTVLPTTNADGTVTITGTVVYGSKVDILHSNGDGDPVIYDVVDFNFRILARPLHTCDLQLPTTGTTFYSGTTVITKPTDYGRFVFQCTACPAISAYFVASPNPVLQGATVTFTANPTTGAHTWYSGDNNNRQLGSSSPTANYVYTVPGVYAVTHYRTENGLTGIYEQDVTVCGIETNSLKGNLSACVGGVISVPFTASVCAQFTSANIFTVQLSDANGNFANAVNIGTWTGSVSGQVSATIPTGTALGTGYRIRVVSSDPAVIGTDNGLNIQVSNCNSSLLYDGIDDRVTVPHNNAYNIGSGDFTIEALVNIAAGAGGNLPILSQRTGAFDGFLIYVYGNQLLLQMNGVPNYLSSSFTSIRDGHCHHVAISRSGTAITFYVDGNSVGTAASGRSLNSTGPLYIGYDSYDQSSFDGSINEVRFWNIARSAADIAANATSSLSASSTGLIGLWRFNEAGQTVVDASSVANNGVLGSTTDVEATDPQRSSVACYSGDRYESETVNKVYAASNNWTVDVAPNPFDSEVSITIESASQTDDLYYVEIFNLQGVSLKAQYIHATDHLTLNDNDLKAGIYLMKISQNGNQQTIKLIKR